MILLIPCISLFLFYSILIIYYWQSWRSVPDYFPSVKSVNTFISVIIAARNEEKNIGTLLSALQDQSYPKDLFEVIVVDDHSEDHTGSIVKDFRDVKLVQLKKEESNSYKKKAIEAGIAAAKGGLMVITDADCLPTKDWLQTMALFQYEKKAVFVAAPVSLNWGATPERKKKRLLSIFQQLDFMMLQGITAASVYKNIHSMCNGANLAYERKAFYEVNGFAGIDKIASGDDMLLMHKIWKKFPHQVCYLKSKDAIISSETMTTWKDFFDQRIRWASKAKFYKDKSLFPALLLVYLFNLSFGVLIIAGIWQPIYWVWLMGFWLAKTVIEFPFVYSVSVFFGKQSLVKYLFFFQPLHIFYTLVSGLFGQFGKYEWKGRRVR